MGIACNVGSDVVDASFATFEILRKYVVQNISFFQNVVVL